MSLAKFPAENFRTLLKWGEQGSWIFYLQIFLQDFIYLSLLFSFFLSIILSSSSAFFFHFLLLYLSFFSSFLFLYFKQFYVFKFFLRLFFLSFFFCLYLSSVFLFLLFSFSLFKCFYGSLFSLFFIFLFLFPVFPSLLSHLPRKKHVCFHIFQIFHFKSSPFSSLNYLFYEYHTVGIYSRVPRYRYLLFPYTSRALVLKKFSACLFETWNQTYPRVSVSGSVFVGTGFGIVKPDL